MNDELVATIDQQLIDQQLHEAWRLVERLLGLPSAMSQLSDPEKCVEHAAQALAEVLGADCLIHWHGSPDVPPPLANPSDLRLTVRLQDAAFASLDLSGGQLLLPMIVKALEHVAVDLSNCLDGIAYRQARAAQHELLAIIRGDVDIDQVANEATRLCVEQTGAVAGLLLRRHTSDFEVLGLTGDWPVDPQAMPSWQAVAQRGLGADGAMAHPGDLITCPVASSSPARLVLLLQLPPGEGPRHNRLSLLSELARAAAPYLDARLRDAVLTQLLELNQASEATSTVELYDKVLRTAVGLIPGAGAGTLLTRQNPGEPFEFQAALGFDLSGLRANPIDEADMRAWYGEDTSGWEQGLPRLLTLNDVVFEEFGPPTTPGTDPQATAYGMIKSTLCLPVLRDGVVMAALNLDNLTDPRAFGNDSIRLANLFGSPLASLLHRQQTHDILRAAALTDELTGLANRRAFDQAVERELGHAARTGSHTSVMVMDVRGFKSINDRFGHEVGDEALTRIARALKGSLRVSDIPARIGGDEFVALLADTPPSEAAHIAQRVRRAIADITIRPGVPLAIDVGIATAPREGSVASELFRVADERMYVEKQKSA